MPIFRAAAKTILFAHVPKCGGTAIESFLKQHFGPLAFLDTKFGGLAADLRWTASSPQHVDAATLARLFPEGFFDLSFAVVRHPAARLRSVFLFQRDIEEHIAADLAFSSWLADLEARRDQAPSLYDNHVRPMSDLVPSDARIFRLEDGLDAVASWLARRLPDQDITPRIPHKNSHYARLKATGKANRPLHLSAADHALIARIYAQDFERFGYGTD
jgi:Sulfotransferase family